MNVGAKVLMVAALVLNLAATPASAQSHVAADIAAWRTYTGTAMGFEARFPQGWHVRSASGTGPETVLLEETVAPGQPGKSVQFWVQRNANPTRLPIDAWYAHQALAMKSSPPPMTSTFIGGRTAVRMELPRAGATHFSYFVALNATDIFQVTLRQASSQPELDPTYATIFSTLRFLK
jgi:hypothetical protein